MILDVEMIHTKVVNLVYNFAVDLFFIWKHLESKIFISKFVDFDIYF